LAGSAAGLVEGRALADLKGDLARVYFLLVKPAFLTPQLYQQMAVPS
jgi:hypothetical protein